MSEETEDPQVMLQSLIDGNVALIKMLMENEETLDWSDFLMAKIDLVISVMAASGIITEIDFAILWEGRINEILRTFVQDELAGAESDDE